MNPKQPKKLTLKSPFPKFNPAFHINDVSIPLAYSLVDGEETVLLLLIMNGVDGEDPPR